MTTQLPGDLVRDLPVHRNTRVQASPAHNERVIVAEFVSANGTFRILFQGSHTSRLVVLTQNLVSLLWEIDTEITFPNPSMTQSLGGSMMSTSQAMFHLTEEPESLPMLPPKMLEYRAGRLLFDGQPMPSRVSHSSALWMIVR